MTRMHSRVPRVHQLEYIYALLNSYDKDGNYSEERALKAIQHEIQEYEQKKARVSPEEAKNC